jgi:hypothetical protein
MTIQGREVRKSPVCPRYWDTHRVAEEKSDDSLAEPMDYGQLRTDGAALRE